MGSALLTSGDRVGAARLTAVDALRGAVMVIMALDHVRDFFHRAALASASPTDLSTTTPLLFMTRWVTHFCAPIFMFTAGLGAYLWWTRGEGRTRSQLSMFLLTRGLLLLVLELTVMRVAYNFDLSFRDPVLLLVLWVLGAGMVVMAALVWLPIPWLAGSSVALIALHNLLDGISASQLGSWAPVWNLLHETGAFPFAGLLVIVGYPLVPWVAVMACGFASGRLLSLAPEARRQRLLWIGSILTVGFVVVRALNVYGDPLPWTGQRSEVYSVLSFLNTTKYPPSLAFLLMTLGPAFVALAWLTRRQPGPANPLVVLGRAPLFFFVLHFCAAHLLALLFAAIRYGADVWRFAFHPLPSMGGPAHLFPPGFGYDLWVVYAVWAMVVVGLYPACRWFATIKEARRSSWLTYL